MAESCPAALPAAEVRPASRLPTRDVLTYGALGLPLAFAALPIYVYTPRLYADGAGLSLAVIGAVLLAARVLDALTDPLLGWLSDRVARRRLFIALFLPVLAAGMLALLAPPAGAGAVWLGVAVFVVTLGFSAITINYGAWGAELAPLPHDRTRVVAAREAAGLCGVVLAAALPGLLAANEVDGLARMAWVFLPVLALAAWITLRHAPPAPPRRADFSAFVPALRAAITHRPFALLLTVFAANGIAAAIPATTVLFFVGDVLAAGEGAAGLFLVLYFVAGAASIPLWAGLARRVGKLRAWWLAMVLAVLVFVWAWTLGVGDVYAFAVICVLSGAALGADLVLPPAMLADLLSRDVGHDDARAGAWFGWWNFVTKANLALAAGLALPVLGLLGYVPGSGEGVRALAFTYALLPCALKLLAAALLWRLRAQLDFEGAMK